MRKRIYRTMGRAACIYVIVGCSCGIAVLLTVLLPMMWSGIFDGVSIWFPIAFMLIGSGICVGQIVIASLTLRRYKKEGEPSAASSALTENEVPAHQEKARACPKCGYRCESDASFCPICGSKL